MRRSGPERSDARSLARALASLAPPQWHPLHPLPALYPRTAFRIAHYTAQCIPAGSKNYLDGPFPQHKLYTYVVLLHLFFSLSSPRFLFCHIIPPRMLFLHTLIVPRVSIASHRISIKL